MNAFTARMNDFEAALHRHGNPPSSGPIPDQEIAALQQTQTDCNEIIEKQQKTSGTGEKSGTAGQL